MMWATSAAVVAVGTEKSAAAMKAKSMTRPKNVKVKNRLTRIVPMRKTKLAMHLVWRLSIRYTNIPSHTKTEPVIENREARALTW